MHVAPRFGTLRVAVHPGNGTVARVGDMVVVVPDADTPVGAILDAARQIEGTNDLAAAASHLERVAGDVSSRFAAVVPTSEAIGVFLSGALDVIEADESGSIRRANEEGTRLVRVAEPFGVAVVTDHDADPPGPGPGAARSWDLEGGAVPGSGVSLVRVADGPPEAEPDGAPTAEETGHDEDDEDEDEEDDEDVAPVTPVDTDDADTGRIPRAEPDITLDEVLPPAEEPPTSEQPESSEPPSALQEPHGAVGMLVLDDGERYVLHGDALIGRDPAHDPDDLSDDVELIRISDPEQHLSRVHAEIHVEDDEALIVDRGSANGTYVSDPDDPGWVRLDPGEPRLLVHGWHLLLGRRAATFFAASSDADRDPDGDVAGDTEAEVEDELEAEVETEG